MKTYYILYNTRDGKKLHKAIKALNIADAVAQGEIFCAKNGRTFYAIN